MTHPTPLNGAAPVPPIALVDLLATLGWRPEHFAARLNEFAAHHGHNERVHPKTPYKWLRGDHPRPPWPSLVSALLSDALTRTVSAADLGWAGEQELVPATAGLILPWTAAGGLQAVETLAHAGDMQRRMSLTLLGTTLTGPAHEWLIAHAAADVARPTGSDLPIDVIDHLDSITAVLRRMDDQLGGGNLRSLVTANLGAVVDLLRNRRYSESTGRRLHSSAAELLRLQGFLAFDAGHHAQAQRSWVAALHAAHAAGDRGLGANILGFMSCQAKDLGQTREAIGLAETARAAYPGTSAKVQAILDLRAAEAYAVDGDITGSRRALDDAFNRFTDPTSEHGDPDWAYWLDLTHAHGQAGYCYLRLHQWDDARTHFRAALRGQGQTRSREGALRQVLMATTYIRQPNPDIDQAIDLASRAVTTLTVQVTSARVTGHVRTLTRHLAVYRRNPAVRSFTEQTRALLATAPSR
jgi:hypothetical protein